MPLERTLLIFALFCISVAFSATPVIIDTDIGQDIDDSWAIALTLNSPDVDIKLILTANNHTEGRAQIVAKYLTTVGKDNVPLGVGIKTDGGVGPLYGWAQDFNLQNYKGPLYLDGVSQAINIITNSDVPVTIIAIAPLTNVAEILRRAPHLASKVIIKAMSGSYKICYGGGKGPCPEYNVAANIPAAKAVYAAQWREAYISPIDIGYVAVINGQNYQDILGYNYTLTKTLIENYVYWREHGGWYSNPKIESTELWDLTAAYMVFSNSSDVLFTTQNMVVNDSGDTVVNPSGRPVHVAYGWITNGVQLWSNLCTHILSGPQH